MTMLSRSISARHTLPITIALGALWAATIFGCGASDAEIRLAKTSGYQVDFAIVYSETLAAVRDLYPTLTENAGAGVIKTAWHPVRIQQGTDDGDGRVGKQIGNSGGGPSAFEATNALVKRYFVRFNVAVVGGKPWRVRVKGQASSWKAGEVPVPLKGADVPSWLGPRTDALRVAIHRRLEKYAVPLKFRSSSEEDKPQAPADLGKYGAVRPGAAKVIHLVREAAAMRDAAALRKLMADDFEWNKGSAPSADTALATWQADSSLMAALVAVLDAGCAEEAGGEVISCAEGDDSYRARFELRDGAWLMSSFVESD